MVARDKAGERGEWYCYAVYALLDNGAEHGNCQAHVASLYMCSDLDWRHDDLRLFSCRRNVLSALLRRGLDALRCFDEERGYHLLHVLCRYGASAKDIRLLLVNGVREGINSLA